VGKAATAFLTQCCEMQSFSVPVALAVSLHACVSIPVCVCDWTGLTVCLRGVTVCMMSERMFSVERHTPPLVLCDIY
jgi:hypothetical protein